MPGTSISPAAAAGLARLLATPRNIALITHFNPDGDAMGSCLGLQPVLRAMGHRVQVVLPNEPPYNLRWMPGSKEALACDKAKDASLTALREADVVICLDFNRPDRVDALEETLRVAPVKVLIDHHRDPDTGFQVMISDTSASSTCQLVYDVIHALGRTELINPDVASCLYAGIMTDSGSFRFPSTSPHTHRVAAELLTRGAQPQAIHAAIMEDNTVDRLRLTGFALNERLQVLEDGAATVIALSKADLERFHYVPGDTEGLVNYGLSVRGVRLSAFLAERNGIIKLSLRSKGNLPVNELLSAHFEGGGHANAAGGRSTGSLEDATAKLIGLLPEFLAKHPQ
jgi:phosphoesterase RecJ-like protein